MHTWQELYLYKMAGSGENLTIQVQRQFLSATIVVLSLSIAAFAAPSSTACSLIGRMGAINDSYADTKVPATMGDTTNRLFSETPGMVADNLTGPGICELTPPVDSAWAEAGRVFFQPPDVSVRSAGSQSNHVKNLPAIPGAILMGMVGFLCVSLVRDRKVWISVFVGIVVLSQTGVKTLPKLTSHLARSRLNNRQAATVAANPIRFDHSFNWLNDLGDRHYIGLLHRLAGSPDGDSAFGNIIGWANCGKTERTLSDAGFLRASQDKISSQPAVIPVQCSFDPLVDKSAKRIISFIYFSPAFIFDNLARGPPILA